MTILPVTSIVSCKTKNEASENKPSTEEKEEAPDFSSLISQFKKDVSTIISEELFKTREKLFELEKDAKLRNKFWVKENIEKNAKQKNLSEEDKKNLESDMKTILSIDNIKSELNKLKNKPEYNVILDGLEDIFENMNVNFESAEFKYKNFSSQEGQELLKQNKASAKDDDYTSNVIVDFVINTKYKDQTNQQAVYETTSKFVYSLTSNEGLKEFGTTSVKEIQNKYFIEENENAEKGIWLDAKSLGLDEKNGLFLDNNNKVGEYFRNKEFGENFLKYFKKEVLETSNNPVIQKLNLSFDNENAFSKIDWNLKLENKTATKYEWQDETGNGKSMFNEIFRNNPIKEELVLAGEKTNVNKGLYNYVKNESEEWFKKYNSGIDTFKSKNQIDFSNKDLSSTSKLGYVYLKGLQFKIDDDYTQELPEFKLLTGYSVNKKEKNWEDNKYKSIEESKTVASIYNNAKQGIDAYIETFGIVNTNNTNNTNILATFSGKTPKIAKNLWDTFKNSVDIYKDQINSSLSLKNDSQDQYNQRTYRDYLLKTGNQETFSWRFVKNSFNMIFNINDSGVVYEYRRFQNGRYTTETGENNLEINFALDFVNITFNVDKIWLQKKLTTFLAKQT